MELHDIQNFVAIDDTYGTSGQPTEVQLCLIAEQGYDAVVNLGLEDPRYCLADEEASIRRLGMSYHHIPVDFQHPTSRNFDQFREVMLGYEDRKVFVHCAANLRVSCFMALFGESDLGWSSERADAHFRKLWSPNEIWTRFFEQTRARLRGGA